VTDRVEVGHIKAVGRQDLSVAGVTGISALENAELDAVGPGAQRGADGGHQRPAEGYYGAMRARLDRSQHYVWPDEVESPSLVFGAPTTSV
jgi:hypothetical protein